MYIRYVGNATNKEINNLIKNLGLQHKKKYFTTDDLKELRYGKILLMSRLIYHRDDDPLIEYQYEDGVKIEPVWYVPVIPMVLINGSDGIGNGWSTKIPNHNP